MIEPKKGELGWRPSCCDGGAEGSACCDGGCQADLEREAIALESPVATSSELIALLPGPHYMDLPDGGDVSVLEQLRRMADDARRFRAGFSLVQLANDDEASDKHRAVGDIIEMIVGQRDDDAPTLEDLRQIIDELVENGLIKDPAGG